MEGALKEVGSVLYGGIRPEIPGHGGEVCARYLTPRQLVGETLVTTVMMIVVGVLGWKTFTMPKVFPKHQDLPSKRILLTFTCLLFGIETGYKICTRSLLYLLNPCHVITMIEVSTRAYIIPAISSP